MEKSVKEWGDYGMSAEDLMREAEKKSLYKKIEIIDKIPQDGLPHSDKLDEDQLSREDT